MATPLSADRLLAALRAEGVRAVEYGSWRTHNRNHKGPWGPVNGLVIHHTAGSNSLGLCVEGTGDLPGPLCHTHLAKDGTARMISAGRANHAGGLAQNAHDAVVAEGGTHPRPDSAEPVDGNAHYYGIEIENLGNGDDPYPEVQYDQAVRWAAGICRAHGWSADSVIGHKEGTRRKIDPSFDMSAFRERVAERLAHAPDWNPDNTEEDDMTPDQAKQLAELHKALVQPTIPTRVNGGASGKSYSLGQHVAGTNGVVYDQQPVIAELLARVGALQGAVASLTEAVGAAGDITAEQVQDAAEAGARAALGVLGDQLAVQDDRPTT